MDRAATHEHDAVTFLALTVTPDHSRIVVSADQGLAPTKARDTLPTGDADVLSAARPGSLEHPTTQYIGLVLQDYCEQLQAFEGEVQRRARVERGVA